MKIRIDEIKEKPLHLAEDEEASVYPPLAAVQESGECEFLEPIHAELTVSREYDHFRVEGAARSRVRLTCSRCLAEYESPVSANFTVFYLRSARENSTEEVELSEQDLVSATFEGDEIDFTEEIANQIFPEIPYKPLCREDCKGLCPTCGADLNSGECGCGREHAASPFSVLKNLKVDIKGEK